MTVLWFCFHSFQPCPVEIRDPVKRYDIHSVVQIYVNLESTPDGGDANNFKLNSDNIISYLFNVTNAKAVPATEDGKDPSTTL